MLIIRAGAQEVKRSTQGFRSQGSSSLSGIEVTLVQNVGGRTGTGMITVGTGRPPVTSETTDEV